MAQRIQTLFIDDLDGSEAAGTVRFALDGTEYEIDLSTAHSEELRNALKTELARIAPSEVLAPKRPAKRHQRPETLFAEEEDAFRARPRSKVADGASPKRLR